MTLAYRRCLHHPQREAVARCPSCHQHFCRECVTEHAGRLLCSACLAASCEPTGRSRRRLTSSLLRVVVFCCSFLLMWGLFYLVGDLLTRLPATYHETSERAR